MPSLQPLLARPFPYNDEPVSTTPLLDSFDQLSCVLAGPRIKEKIRNIHSDFGVVAPRRKHARVRRIPRYSTTARRRMCV